MVPLESHLIKGFILINQFFKKNKVRYCLIGGLCAGFWGRPRYTQDMDFTVFSKQRNLQRIIHLLKKENFKVIEKNSSQIQVVKKDRTIFQADLVLAETDYQDWVIQRARLVSIFEIEVPICSPEDLIILKLIANRRKDFLDIESVLQNSSIQLDQAYLQEWMDFWDISDRFETEFGKDVLGS